MEMEPASNFLQYVHAGELKALAITSINPLQAAPKVPTADQAGLANFHRSLWIGLWMPKGAPGDVRARILTAVRTALADQRVNSRVSELGQQIFPPERQTPEALAQYQQSEIDVWWPIVKEGNIKLNQ